MRRDRLRWLVAPAAVALAATAGAAGASTPGPDARLTNDAPGSGGYTSAYTLATGIPYTDVVLDECSRSRGRENEPSVAIDPRDVQVVVGSSNDYCGVYDAGDDADGAPIPAGPIWLGSYRSQDGGGHFTSSLVPGYPGDTSPYASRAQARTASAGDPVLAWDGDGRLFAGAESSSDPSGTKKSFGDVWVATYHNPGGPKGATADDGKEFLRSVVVDRGSSAPDDKGQFNDKTAIAADRTSNPATRGNVYFAWSRFQGNSSSIFVSRSTDHGATFSKPVQLTTNENDVQFADLAINGDGTLTATWVSTLSKGKVETDALRYATSRDGGRTFTPARTLQTFEGYSAQDQPAPSASSAPSEPDVASAEVDGGSSAARDCGSLGSACASGFIFFRVDSQARSAADQGAAGHDVYVVFDPSVPGSEVATGTTYGSVAPGTGSQQAVYALRFDPLAGTKTGPVQIAPEASGHQLFPDVAVDAGKVHVLWWDSRNDVCYSPMRPVGNCADGTLTPSLDVYATTLDRSTLAADTPGGARVTDETSNPNWDQFSGRTVPFAGDYLWIDAVGDSAYGVWTDYRNTQAGDDPRTTSTRGDVLQCRTQRSDGSWTGDTCPRDGGLDQDVYGDAVP
jgi:hypothetical protein